MAEIFTGSFTQQEPIPDEAIAAAVAVMRHGRLHRYNTAAGEIAETAALEEEFATFTGARYCLAVASGGAAMRLAMRAAGVGPGSSVLTNAFTLAPVPGAIAALGAVPVFVETTPALTIDLADLAAKARPGMVLLLSHMRGHLVDMEALMPIAEGAGLRVIEDCAHTMGAAWNGTPSGRHGLAGCYSTQTYKHMNSGEGGLIVTDDADLMARMVLLSGSYMLYDRHRAAPGPDAYATLREDIPNVSSRMDNLRAAILRPQIPLLADRTARWRLRHDRLEAGLQGIPGLHTIPRPPQELFVGSSFQFLLPGRDGPWIDGFLARCFARGVELKWFGRRTPAGFTSSHHSWRYAPEQALPKTDAVLAGLIDMRLPLTFSLDDCDQIARIIAAEAVSNAPAPAIPARQGD
ncbi:dTDP-4-amino-4,6-dideoxygalactose transaminase [Gemmobacter megaterium]|uniref:dTDP-4-amino-4,6-dideoxygalactose transaminase n=1 Tax=Gemmobacter megaterium TaxID=1086013 RepID=A0A1N7KBI0_9RHOB|nr:DegT/DnrJ/EryC1/StrS family aminotransferase [Gemmobacter megaterium]GGE01239.1 aminotransferase DegT [Gemmobacter megaterium]SIS58955.1 dTDP-4-amino-4,6-dideoxygalactose transaminase [Gemmobacter megaterium]